VIICKCGHEIPEKDPAGNKFPKSLLNVMIKRHVDFEHKET